MVTIKYSQTGSQIWNAIYNGPANGDDAGLALDFDNLNNVYVGGGSQGDYIVIKYSQFVGNGNLSNEIPNIYRLFQNYPNPFNATTNIEYSIPNNSKVTIKVYDILGRMVKELVNEFKEAGIYTVHFDAGNYASGVCFYQIEAGTFVNTKKMVLVK